MTHLHRFNCILARYEGGHIYVDKSNGAPKRETYINMLAVKERNVATSLALEILEIANRTYQSEASDGVVKAQSQIPYVGWSLKRRLGGTGENKMVTGFTATQTDDGFASVTLELDDPLRVGAASLLRKIERISRGAASEYGTPHIHEQTRGGSTDSTPPGFSISGLLTQSSERVSPLWVAPRGFWCSWLQVQLRVPGTTRTRVAVARRSQDSPWSTSVASVILPPGIYNGIVVVNQGWSAGEGLYLAVPEVGNAATDLSVALRGNMI